MPAKLANNASTRLAATLSVGATQLAVTDASKFPALASGDWYPLTLIKQSGDLEIVRVTAATGNLLTVARAQEGTAQTEFAAGDRAELRLTAGAFQSATGEPVAALEASVNARMTSAEGRITTAEGKVATIEAKLPQIDTNTAGIANINARMLTFTPVQQGGGAYQATNKVYMGWDGSGLRYQVDSTDRGRIWDASNFNPASYMPLAGGNFSGNFGIYNTSPTVMFYDTDWGPRQLHCNGGLIGFLNSGGGWAVYSDDGGNLIASGNVAAYSDRKHKTRIRTLEDGLDIALALRGVRYTRKRDGRPCVGLIAQEVQEVLPEVVMETPDGLSVDYGNVCAVLVEAIKRLTVRVKRLEAR